MTLARTTVAWAGFGLAAALAQAQNSPAVAGSPAIDAPSQVWANARVTPQDESSGYRNPAQGTRQAFITRETVPARLAYTPLTSREKFEIFRRTTYSPYTFLNAAFGAGLAEATGDGRGYGGGPEGYGKRYGAALADSESGIFFGRFLFPVFYKQDPRYFRMDKGSVIRRVFYAASRVAITRNDDGENAPNFSNISGTLASATLSNAYYPREKRGVTRTFVRTGNGLISAAETNLFKEFWPDISRKFLPRRIREMKSIQKIEQCPVLPSTP